MWLIVNRQPRPDTSYWSGRRWLAAVDAVAWPLGWVWVVRHMPTPVGVVGPIVTALALLLALERLHRALYVNHRYWFTTWRWGKVVATVLLVGVLMQVAMMF
jgi:hypothetical protein